jgi:hypothetical protein
MQEKIKKATDNREVAQDPKEVIVREMIKWQYFD